MFRWLPPLASVLSLGLSVTLWWGIGSILRWAGLPSSFLFALAIAAFVTLGLYALFGRALGRRWGTPSAPAPDLYGDLARVEAQIDALDRDIASRQGPITDGEAWADERARLAIERHRLVAELTARASKPASP